MSTSTLQTWRIRWVFIQTCWISQHGFRPPFDFTGTWLYAGANVGQRLGCLNQPHNLLWLTPTNSSQSVTLPQFRQFLHNKPIDVRYYVLLLGTILSGNITYFCSIVAFLNEVVIIDIKFNLRNKMGLKRMFRWLLLAVMPLFILAGCGDLEPDMQDTRTVILNMDFHGKSSSRSSSSVSASELSQYNTHLILALPSGGSFDKQLQEFS